MTAKCLAAPGALLLLICCMDAAAEGYLLDSRDHFVRNSYGECWHTGSWTPAMRNAECDKVPSTPLAAPSRPEPVAPPAAAAPVAVRLGAQTLFDFDQAVIKPEGRVILDEKIVARMKQLPAGEVLTITGHADRIGSEAYNQKLSERRADAVRDYLVARGLSAERLSASGKGETVPDPAADTIHVCRGIRGQKLISCLQPDRRVIVESPGK